MKNKGQGRFSSKIYPGARFGKLTVIERIPGVKEEHRAKVRCRCDCGKITEPDSSALVSRNTKSCGCQKFKGFKNKIGDKFWRLTIVEINFVNRRTLFTCLCSCGKTTVARSDMIISGNKKSCGCLNEEVRREVCIRRNKETAKFDCFSCKYPRTFIRWRSMIERCYKSNTTTYKDYGAKGVLVCNFLKESPWSLKAIIGLSKKIRHSLDRHPIHNGNYTCGQCQQCKDNNWKLNIRWATRKDQSNNRGNFNVYLTAFGRRLTRSQWQDISGINESVIAKRIDVLGWSIQKALTTPNKNGNCFKP